MRYFVLIFIAISFLMSCKNNDDNIKIENPNTPKDTIIDTQQELNDQISKLTLQLKNDSLNFNTKHAQELLDAYAKFIKYESFDSISKDYQFKAGELAKALNKPDLAIKYFNDLVERDPKYKKAPLALFYKAVVIGDMLHEDELAKKTYQEFIDKYPNHPLVESAKQSIKLQGKPLDEIVKGFEKKNS